MFNKNIKLTAQKTRIRKFKEIDISLNYLKWLNDKERMKYSNQRFFTHDQRTALVYLESFKDTPNGFFAIESIQTGAMIGTITAYCNLHHKVVDVGIMIGDKNSHGQGFGYDSWSVFVDWLSQYKDIRKITAGTLSINKPMIKIAKNSGMQSDGFRRAQELVKGLPVDTLYFAKYINT